MASPRPEVAALPLVVHGAVKDSELRLLAEAGVRPEDVADFSVNSNPLGPSPAARAVLTKIDIERYPDDQAAELRGALAERFQVSPDQVVVANGSAEVIWLLCLAYVRPGDPVAIFGPTFGEYERAARLMGARTEVFQSVPHDGPVGAGASAGPEAGRAQGPSPTGLPRFDLDVAGAASWLGEVRARLAFLCNPNNPTGACLDVGAIEALMAASPETLLVVDEAYAAFLRPSPELETLVPLVRSGQVVLLRSMTKDYALAGLRLGYALAESGIAGALLRAKPPWSVNRAALATGLACLRDERHLTAAQAAAAEATTYLQRTLSEAGFRVYETRANFFLIEVGDAASVRSALLRQGLVVRDCTSFGLPSMIRVAARQMADCRRLVQALAGSRVRA